MRASSMFTVILRLSWLAGVLVPLLLTACATRRAEVDTGRVDIGYGEVDEEHVDGSVETAEAEDEPIARTRTLVDMLGRLPGVWARVEGDQVTVRIRGSSSFLASEEPLVVVDGMMYGGSLRGIDPATIDSITILKNAAETAVYGARGANGVILIKTKSVPGSAGA